MKSIHLQPIFLGFLFTALSVSVLGQSTHSSRPPAQAADTFNSYCAVCHGPDGTGSSTGKALNAPNLRSAAVQKQSNAALVRFIREGKEPMPPFKGQLTDEQIAEAAAYVHWLGRHKARQ
jgi:mono/diheme cytochrome c family protein